MKKLFLAAALLLSVSSFAQQKTLIIDAAHGGNDNGAVAVDGISESYITYDFAQALKKAAVASGYTVVLTRPERGSSATMEERAAIIAKYPGNTRFISLHVNTSANTELRGAEIIFDGDNGAANGSKAWAESLKAAIAPKTTGVTLNSRNKLRVLTGSPVPAVAVELGYLSNLFDLQLLETASYQAEVAKLIVSSIQ